MKKTHVYAYRYFDQKVVRKLIDEFGKVMSLPLRFSQLTVMQQDTTWHFNDIEEFFEDYKKSPSAATMSVTFKPEDSYSLDGYGLDVYYYGSDFKIPGFTLTIQAPNRAIINRLFEITDEALHKALVLKIADKKPELIIFIGHGRSKDWRDLKDHLVDKHHYHIESYESGARAGHTIRDILDDMLSKSNFALLVLTAEDEMSDGIMRARQNVIHETGLFQGRLGFSRAIVLMEEGVEEFSNIFGVQQLRFSKGNIKEIFGDVLATLKREFPS